MLTSFISYRRTGSQYVAAILAESIEHTLGSGSVFLDVDNVPPGVDFRDHISRAIATCDVVLVLIGNDWLEAKLPDGTRRLDDPGDYVRFEVATALARQIPVIPVLLESCQMPRPEELPSDVRELAYRNAVHLSPGRELRTHISVLIQNMKEMRNDSSQILYDFDTDRTPFDSWHLFQPRSTSAELVNDEQRKWTLSTQSTEPVGVNLSVSVLSGRVSFEYRITDSSVPNMVFFMIPMQYMGLRQRLVEVGTDFPGDPENGESAYRVRYLPSAESYDSGDWCHGEIDFDFSATPTAAYAIFGPRINEGCTEQASGSLEVRRVQLFSS